MEYKATIDEIAALAMFFTGWTRADLMGLTVRERRYWIKMAAYVRAQRERARDGR